MGDPWPANVVRTMRGTRCPGPIIEAGRFLHGMQDGDVLKLVSNCKGTSSDAEGWAGKTTRESLGKVEDGNGT